jgi:omega-6 fatty acid desaturase (delta-12 desaturase)
MNPGKELVIATKPFMKESVWMSWYYTVSTVFVLALLMTGTLVLNSFLLRLLCSISGGLVMVRLFVISHDFQHHAILHKSPLADFLFTIFGIYTLVPSTIWKRSHDYHHTHNSKLFSASIGSYAIMERKKFAEATESEKKIYLASRHPLTILFGYVSMFMWGMCVESLRSNFRKHWDSLISLIVHFSLSIFIIFYAGLLTWIFFIFIPFFVSGMIGAYLFYAQHNFPGVTFRNNNEWSYSEAAMESSSYMVMNPFWRWVTANIGYHHIHHLNARIPFYRLPEVMEHFPELQKAKKTSLNPTDIIACLRLKLWDASAKKMISLAEL